MKLVQRRPNMPMQIAAQCAGRVVFLGKKHHLVGKGADALALRAGTEITRLPIKNYASHSRVILPRRRDVFSGAGLGLLLCAVGRVGRRIALTVQAAIASRGHAYLGLEHATEIGAAAVAQTNSHLLQWDGLVAQEVEGADELLLADIGGIGLVEGSLEQVAEGGLGQTEGLGDGVDGKAGIQQMLLDVQKHVLGQLIAAGEVVFRKAGQGNLHGAAQQCLHSPWIVQPPLGQRIHSLQRRGAEQAAALQRAADHLKRVDGQHLKLRNGMVLLAEAGAQQ